MFHGIEWSARSVCPRLLACSLARGLFLSLLLFSFLPFFFFFFSSFSFSFSFFLSCRFTLLLGCLNVGAGKKRERVKKQMGGKTANKNKTIALQNKQKQNERASLHNAKQRSGRMQKDHQREQREKGIQRSGNAVGKAGKTASRIESVFFQIFSTNQRSVVVAQSI